MNTPLTFGLVVQAFGAAVLLTAGPFALSWLFAAIVDGPLHDFLAAHDRRAARRAARGRGVSGARPADDDDDPRMSSSASYPGGGGLAACAASTGAAGERVPVVGLLSPTQAARAASAGAADPDRNPAAAAPAGDRRTGPGGAW